MIDVDSRAQSILRQLFQNAEKDEWCGWDPYDALSSPWVRALSLSIKPLRIAWIQGVKRSPVNLRPWLGVPKLENPKALALFASAAFNSADHDRQVTGHFLLERLLLLRSQNTPGYGWGYPFDWQSRAFFAPRQTPNVIVTTFCGQAFLDAFQKTKDRKYLDAAIQACHFVLEGLHRTRRGKSFCFSYTPLDHSQIHNANFLAAALLCRTGLLIADRELLDEAMRATTFSLEAQAQNGSWAYGEAPNQQWVDNFHTGFNLTALRQISKAFPESDDISKAIDEGLAFYRAHFFLANGAPRYLADETWPIDIHSAAQAILTFTTFADSDPSLFMLATQILSWTLENLFDDQTGHFYFQKHRHFTIRTPFMRWSDAWMSHSLVSYLAQDSLKVSHVTYAAS